jgi:hypothetical protein
MNAWHNVFETHSTVEFYSFSCDESWLYLTVLFLVNLSSPLDTVVCPKVVVCFSKGNMNRVFFRRRHHLPDIGDGSSSIPNTQLSLAQIQKEPLVATKTTGANASLLHPLVFLFFARILSQQQRVLSFPQSLTTCTLAN